MTASVRPDRDDGRDGQPAQDHHPPDGSEDPPTTASGASPASSHRDSDATRPAFTDDEVFDILRNSRRRRVLSFLLENSHRATVPELTEYVAANEYDVAPDDLGTDQYKRVYTALYQCHLPRLEDFGVVGFDRAEKTVRIEDLTPRIRGYLQGARRTGVDHLSMVVAGVVAAVVVPGVVGVGPLGGITHLAWAVLTVGGLAAVASLQLYAAMDGSGFRSSLDSR